MQLAYPSHVMLANTRTSFENTYLYLSEGAKRLMPTLPMLRRRLLLVAYYTEGDTRRNPKDTMLSGLFIVRPNMLIVFDRLLHKHIFLFTSNMKYKVL